MVKRSSLGGRVQEERCSVSARRAELHLATCVHLAQVYIVELFIRWIAMGSGLVVIFSKRQKFDNDNNNNSTGTTTTVSETNTSVHTKKKKIKTNTLPIDRF